MAVTIQIGSAQALIRSRADSEFDAGAAEGAVAIGEQYQHLILVPAIHCEVKLAVSVKNGRGGAVWRARAGRRERRAGRENETSFAIAAEHGHPLNAMIGNGDIKVAVLIEIAYRKVVGRQPRRKRRALGLA